jgi:hypothetical protein
VRIEGVYDAPAVDRQLEPVGRALALSFMINYVRKEVGKRQIFS